MRYFRKPAPILDIDLEAGDTYLAELSYRAQIARTMPGHEDDVFAWIN